VTSPPINMPIGEINQRQSTQMISLPLQNLLFGEGGRPAGPPVFLFNPQSVQPPNLPVPQAQVLPVPIPTPNFPPPNPGLHFFGRNIPPMFPPQNDMFGEALYESPAIKQPNLVDAETKAIEMTGEENAKKNQIFNIVEELVLTVFSQNTRIRVEVYGSVAMGLALSNSDLDIRVVWGWPLQKNEEKRMLFKLKNVIEENLPELVFIKVIPAKVPIIKFKEFGIECDISILAEENWKARGTIELITNVLKIDPRVRPLILAVKNFAKLNGIGDATLRLLNSYGWTILVISFLQNASPPILPPLSCLLDGTTFARNSKVYKGTSFNPSSSISEWLQRVKTPNTQPCSRLFDDFLHWKIFKKPSSAVHLTVNVFSGEISIAEQNPKFQVHISDPLDIPSNVARALDEKGWDKIHETLLLF